MHFFSPLYPDQIPKHWNLQHFTGRGGTECRIIDHCSSRWEELATALHLELHTINSIRRATEYHSMEDRCRAALRHWLEGQGRKPVTWKTLIVALNECKFGQLSKTLETICS